MRRMFYIAFGAAAGVLVVRRAARAASALSPQSMAGSLVQSVQEFVADVREGMTQREEEIREALGLDGDGNGEPVGQAEDADDDERPPAGAAAAAGSAARASQRRPS